MTEQLNTTSANNSVNHPAMAFYNPEGFVPAWRTALAYAGHGGRVATLPDIIAARLGSASNEPLPPWNVYFTTASAEYLGKGANGRLILIVAHGVGPLANIDGLLRAYSHEYKDRDRNRHGGRITQAEFLKLERGEYGPVSIIDFQEYSNLYAHPFQQRLSVSEALADPLVAARLGPQYKKYIRRHAAESTKYMRAYNREITGRVQTYVDPTILEMRAASHTSYRARMPEEGFAFAHLLVIGQLVQRSHEDHGGEDSLVCDVHLYEWWNGVRLVGVSGSASPNNILSTFSNLPVLKNRHPELFMKEVTEVTEVGFRALVSVEGTWFTSYLTKGTGVRSFVPEFAVTKMEVLLKGPKTFSTASSANGDFEYNIADVERTAPLGANAFRFEGDVAYGGKNGPTVGISFYRIEVDNTQRLRRDDELYNDVDLLVKLAHLLNSKA
ncbi:MAG: hypothetical protein P4L53_23935 [Candidatus Obscuribacterales bacterium]|nr:hypothetical protein [Candidatus Obscuribacterales bacterium]